VITGEKLSQFGSGSTGRLKPEPPRAGFAMEDYLSRYSLEVVRRKSWQSHAGGLIFELAVCPFNSAHTDGSAAFTLADGVPGFTCKHNGCHRKTMRDILAMYPAEPSERVLEQPDPAKPRSDDEAKRGGTQAQQLIQLAQNVQLFHTPEGDPYGQAPVGDHYEVWPIRSRGFRRWLIGQFYRAFCKPPGNQGLQDALGVFEAQAYFDSPESTLYVRIAEHSDRIYIDLGDDQRHAVEISAAGWRVLRGPPVRFRRTRGMRALPQPVAGGSIDMLRPFLNVGYEGNWTLVVSWLMAAFRPKGPYPILILQGEQGSAKSTTAKLLRRLIDPSVSGVRRPPRDDRDLLIAASSSWVLAYDNLSGIPPWLSDALCQLATGGGFSTRELYTDADEVFFDAVRPVILNGIDHLAERADLADRALIINLPPIEETNRKDEAQLYAEFDRDLPQILGALFSALGGTLAGVRHTHLDRKPRLADFALWATAAERPLGFLPGAFARAYCGNREEAIQETLEADPVGAAVLAMMDQLDDQCQTQQWEGTCKDLLQRLESDDKGKAARSWPKSPRGLSNRLRRLATFLRESGIHISFPTKGAKGRRVLTIFRTALKTTATSATSAS